MPGSRDTGVHGAGVPWGMWPFGGSVSPPVRRGQTWFEGDTGSTQAEHPAPNLQWSQEGSRGGGPLSRRCRPQVGSWSAGTPGLSPGIPGAHLQSGRRSPRAICSSGAGCVLSALRQVQAAQTSSGDPPGLAGEGLLHPHRCPLTRSWAGHCSGPGSEGASGSGHPGLALAGPRSIGGCKGDVAVGLLSRSRTCQVYGV